MLNKSPMVERESVCREGRELKKKTVLGEMVKIERKTMGEIW